MHQHPQHAGLSLPAESQKQHVVLRQDGVLDLGDDRLVVPQNARKQRFLPAQPRDQVLPHLRLDRPAPVAAGPQFAECLWQRFHANLAVKCPRMLTGLARQR